MGKAKRLKVSKKSNKVPLDQQINDSRIASKKDRNKIFFRQEEKQFVECDLSNKILSVARQQQLELEDEFGPTPAEAYGNGNSSSSKQYNQITFESDDEQNDFEEQQNNFKMEDNFDMEINEEDERALEMFMRKNPQPTKNLADLIMDKITEKQSELQTQFSDVGSIKMEELDPRVKQLYEGVRDVLKKYRSGKLPKAFKIIPKLKNWEQLLYVTEPATWSAAAMYQGTRIFASNLKDRMAQRFYNLVLLPRIRDDLHEFKRLNFHLYQALRKALFKPAAFMKGLLLPLLESGNCTLREAIIVGSVISRNSIPMLHSAAAILKIAEMDYTGANSIFLRIFFDKKYALPYRVIDACVFHFLKFETDKRELPVLWHQAFLAFVQRYKSDISSEQRDALLCLLRKQSHAKITPEIRRELQNAKCRDVEMKEPEEGDRSGENKSNFCENSLVVTAICSNQKNQ